MNNQQDYHEPVMIKEVQGWLGLLPLDLEVPLQVNSFVAKRMVDATLGFGGHTLAILKKGVSVLGIEADEETLRLCEASIASAGLEKHFHGILGNFVDIEKIAQKANFTKVDAVLFDLGINSYQLDRSGRGISFRALEDDLDMRLDKTTVRASDLLAALDKTNLERLFGRVLTTGLARRLAGAIVEAKSRQTITKVQDLVEICDRTFGHLSQKVLPKVFLALRMAVNREMESLQEALPKAFDLLLPHGRLLVISFHSTEDRVVKDFFTQMVGDKKAINLTKAGLKPTDLEVRTNPRSRSARLRVLEKKEF